MSVFVPTVDAFTLAGAAVLDHGGSLGTVYCLSAFVLLLVSGSARNRINPRLSLDLSAILPALAIPVLIAAPFASSDARVDGLFPAVPVAMALVLGGRLASYRAIRSARSSGRVIEPTLIVGAGRLGVRVADTLLAHPEFGLAPVGFLESFQDATLPLPVLGDPSELESVVSQEGVKRVIVAFGALQEPEMVRILRAADELPIEIYVLPRFFELGVGPKGPDVEDIWGIPLMRLRRSALRGAAWRTKRAFDLVVGSLALVLTSPLLGASALAVRLSSPGPIFFRQKRVGQRGQIFELLKFRTLRVNDDSDTKWSVSEDAGRTRVGRILRRCSLDELPQLINVLRGEMSLIGPRPERPFFVDQFRVSVRGYDDRHRVPVGLTGWAQVHGLRGDTSIEERAIFDNHYVEHWSLWQDLVIFVRTVVGMFRGGGA